MNDKEYMGLALELAKKGCGFVNPNPMVGAVIVKENRIIGQGFHERYGKSHGEINALSSCKESPIDATIYVTLEPCCHYGKTPPCTQAILESGISKVVIGSSDPNSLVAGKGVEILKNHGITVVEQVLRNECDELNQVFFHFIKNKVPFIAMKYAMTMDGKIATDTGSSKWITGAAARQHVHTLRHKYSAIMVGVGTILSDDPLLTCRIENGRNPTRILCDTTLRTPLSSKIVTTAKEVRTILATACNDTEMHKPYLQAGCEVLVIPQKKESKHIDLAQLMISLGNLNIDSILLEGGSTLNWSALQGGMVNKLYCYIAPKLLGGRNSKSPIGGIGVHSPENAFLLKNSKMLQIGEDFLIESEVMSKCLQEL